MVLKRVKASSCVLIVGQEDFFIVLHNMLAKRVEVSDIQCVKDAKVPLMRFKFEGISIDLPYAQLQVKTVPEVSLIFFF